MKRYYILDENNFINGSFSIPQLGISTLILEEEIIKSFKKPKWNGTTIIEGKTILEEREEKLSKLREIRNNLLFQTVTAIQQQYRCEQDDQSLNGNNTGKITEAKYKEWLIYWRTLRDLPDIINIDNYTLENIETAFPSQPI